MSSCTAISLNNRGVHLLECGKYKQAAREFSRGLAIAHMALFHYESNEDCNEDPLYSISCGTPTGHFHKAAIQEHMHSASHWNEEDKLNIEDNQLFMFTSSIIITEDSANREVSKLYFIELSFMLLYNLALCHHLYARSGQDDVSQHKLLEKARSLYEMAFAIQRAPPRPQQDDDDSHGSSTLYQTMAVTNNLGCIHATLKNEEYSRYLFEFLLSTVMFVKHPHNGGGGGGAQAEVEEQWDGSLDTFLSNALAIVMTSMACHFASAA